AVPARTAAGRYRYPGKELDVLLSPGDVSGPERSAVAGDVAGSPLADAAHVAERPVDEDRLAVDVLAGDVAPHAAVDRLAPMVAENEIVALGDDLLLAVVPRTDVAIIVRDVVLDQGGSVYIHLPAIHADPVAGDADHALDVRLRSVPGKPEDHGVAAL